MISKVFSGLALAGVLTLAPLAASAQVTPPPGGQRQRLEMERRLQLGFGRSVQNQLGLDPETVQGIQEIMRSFQEERSALNRTQASLRFRLRDPALQDIGEDEAKAVLQEMLAAQQRELDLYKSEQAELLKVMSPVEVVRFYGLREDLGRRVQQLRQGQGRGSGGGGVGGQARASAGGGTGGRFFR